MTRKLPVGAKRLLAIMRATGWRQPRLAAELEVDESLLFRWLTSSRDQCRLPSYASRNWIWEKFPHVPPKSWGKAQAVGQQSPRYGKKEPPRS